MAMRRTDYTYSANTDTSVIYGLIQYTNRKHLSLVEVAGYSAHAFRLIIHEETVDVGSYSSFAWPEHHIRELGSMGYRASVRGGPTLQPPTPEEQQQGLAMIQDSLDRGIPVMAWDLFTPEFGLIYGYNDETRTLRCRDVRLDGELPYTNLGRGQIGEMYLLTITDTFEPDRVEMLQGAVRMALEHAHDQLVENVNNDNRNGLAGYDAWIRAFETRKINPFGNAVNTDKVCDAREFAAEFLRQTAVRWQGKHRDDQTIRHLLEEAASHYDVVAGQLSELRAMFPCPDGGTPNDEEQAAAAIRLLQAAKEAEKQGLGVLKALLEKLEHYEGDRMIDNTPIQPQPADATQDEDLFQQYAELRVKTITEAMDVPEDMLDIIPKGSKTSIRWHLGHILVSWDHAIFPNLQESWRMPTHYHYLFPRGRTPADWVDEPTAPPSYKELLEKLRTQSEEIIASCRGRMDDPLAKPFLNIPNIRGIFRFAIKVEARHLETILQMKKKIMNQLTTM